MMKKLLCLVAAIAMTFGLFGCGSGNTAAATIKIGINTEMTGAVASYGTAEQHGYDLAIKLTNANGGVLGKQIEVVELDNKSDSAESTSVATRLVSEKVSLILGPATTGDVQAELPVCEDSKIPMVTPSATGETVMMNGDKAYQYAYRTCFKDSYQGEILSKFVKNNLGMSNVVVLFDNNQDYTVGVKNSFVSSFQGLGGTVVDTEVYTSGDTDFASIITAFSGKKYDAIMIAGYYTEAGLIIKQARAQGIDCPIVGPDGFDSSELGGIAGADACNNVYFSTHYSSLDNSQAVADFVAAYKKEYNEEPNAFAALGYDAAMLAFDAITRANSTEPEKINAALASTTSFSGVTGTIAINDVHDAVKSGVIVKLTAGVQSEVIHVN